MKKLRVVLRSLCAALTLLAASETRAAEPAPKPNILYIVADTRPIRHLRPTSTATETSPGRAGVPMRR
jgi:hypothetical protein